MSDPKLDKALEAAIIMVLYHQPMLSIKEIVSQTIEVMESLEVRTIDGTSEGKTYANRIKQLLKREYFGVSLDYHAKGRRTVLVLEKSA